MFGELLSHEAFSGYPALPEFSLNRLRRPELFWATAAMTPLEAKLLPSQSYMEGSAWVIQKRVLAHKEFSAYIYTPGHFRVAPKEWPEGVPEVFPESMRPAPTPMEVMRMLLPKGVNRPREVGKMEWSAFWWWMLGIPGPILSEMVPDWEDAAKTYLERQIQRLRFSLWALSPDLRPLIRGPHDARCALAMYGFTRQTHKIEETLRKWKDSIYIQSLLAPNSGHKPLPRPDPGRPLMFSYPSARDLRTEQDKLPAYWKREMWNRKLSAAAKFYPREQHPKMQSRNKIYRWLQDLAVYLPKAPPEGTFP